jgi:hypothetical protein
VSASPPATRSSSEAQRDIATVVAISIVCFVLTVQFHEFAHATTAVLLGAKVFTITTGSVRYDDTVLSNHGNQAVAASATLFNFAAAAMLFAVRRLVPRANPRMRYALWLGMALNAFVPAGYLSFSPLFGFGDRTLFLRWCSAMRSERSAAPSASLDSGGRGSRSRATSRRRRRCRSSEASRGSSPPRCSASRSL